MGKPCNDAYALRASEIEKQRFWTHVEKTSGCWLFTPVTAAGYGHTYLSGKHVQAHRATKIWADGCGNLDAIACHLCTNRNCVNPDHIYWGTHLSNAHDRKRDGTNNFVPKGEKHLRAKLKAEDVVYIWQKIAGGNVAANAMARQFGVSVSAIEQIVAGKNWAHLTKNLPPIAISRAERGSNRGTNHPKAKLDEEKVREIRKLSASGLSASKIGAQMNVSREAIAMLLQGRSWKHVV